MTSRKIAGVLLAAAFLGRYSSGRDESAPDPQQLLEAVHKASSLSPLDSYVLTARVIVNPGDSKREQTGKLTISRDHDLSRTELEISGTDEVRIHRNHVGYIVPSQRLLPQSGLAGLDKAWDPLSSNMDKGETRKLGKARAETWADSGPGASTRRPPI